MIIVVMMIKMTMMMETTTIMLLLMMMMMMTFSSSSSSFAVSQLRRKLSLTRTFGWSRRNRVKITCNTSGTYHMQYISL